MHLANNRSLQTLLVLSRGSESFRLPLTQAANLKLPHYCRRQWIGSAIEAALGREYLAQI